MNEREKAKLRAILQTLCSVSYTALEKVKELEGTLDDKTRSELSSYRVALEDRIQDLFD